MNHQSLPAGEAPAAPEPARPSLQQLLSRLDFDSLRDTAEQCRQAAHSELALELYRLALALRPDDAAVRSRMHSLLRDLGLGEDLYSYSSDLLTRLVRLFRGREGVHAVQFRQEQQGRSGYRPVHREAGELDWRAHLEGDVTLGIYPVREDGTVWFGAIDVDVRKDFLAQRRLDAEFASRLDAHLRTQMRTLLERFERAGCPATLEWSGNKGYHLWLFLAEPAPASTVRRLLGRLAGTVPEGVAYSIEIFPKQDRVPPGGLGNLIKVPLGVHLTSGRRSCFLDPGTFEPIDAARAIASLRPVRLEALPETLLRECEKTPRAAPAAALPESGQSAIEAAARAVRCRGAAVPSAQARRTPDAVPTRGGEVSTRQAGTQPHSEPVFAGAGPGGLRAVRSLARGCPVVAELIRKAGRERHLTHPERIVLLYTLGKLGAEGAAALHRVMSCCSDYDPEVTQRQLDSVRSNAIGCRGVQRWLQDGAYSQCHGCRFVLGPGQYRSPLLHVTGQGQPVPAPPYDPGDGVEE
jgi:hypothetical protein